MVHTMLAALGPIVLGFLVGWLSGKYGFIKREYAQAIRRLRGQDRAAFALFLAAATASSILNVDYALALAVGLVDTYIVAYMVGKFIFSTTTLTAL